jgi:hypothetical protein
LILKAANAGELMNSSKQSERAWRDAMQSGRFRVAEIAATAAAETTEAGTAELILVVKQSEGIG